MKKFKKYIKCSLLSIALISVVTSCDSFLDTLPDNRTELHSADQISKLLVSAYSTSYPAFMAEMASDNTDENASVYTAYGRFQTQAYNWTDVTEIEDNDTPQGLWESYYTVFSTCNTALQYIRASDSTLCTSQKGEALVCRAYAGFMLSTVFCHAYDETTAATNLGLPYPTVPESSVGEKYERGSLSDLYKKIAVDLEQGIPLLSNNYDEPKYHFTQTAAYAFAARFYLYYHQYDKAIAYATKALGSTPANKLRDWASWNALSQNGQIRPNAYVSSSLQTNFLLISAQCNWPLVAGPYDVGCGYTHNSLISKYETIAAEGPWGVANVALNYSYASYSDLPKVIIRKIGYYFEYSDKVSQIGYTHTVFSAFNAEETLLCRAEAYALQHNYPAAVNDINILLSKFSVKGISLTLSQIVDYYNNVSYYTTSVPTVKKKFNTSFAIESTTEEPLLQCILQLRRLLTIHDGLRWQDIKRYGMVIYRRQLNTSNKIDAITDSLSVKDPRRALQLPQDVIAAGMQANSRN